VLAVEHGVEAKHGWAFGGGRRGTHVDRFWRRAGEAGPLTGHGLDNRGHGFNNTTLPGSTMQVWCATGIPQQALPRHASTPSPTSKHPSSCLWRCSWVGRSPAFTQASGGCSVGNARGPLLATRAGGVLSRGMASIIEAMGHQHTLPGSTMQVWCATCLPQQPCHATPRRHSPPASTHAPACCVAPGWVGPQPSHRLHARTPRPPQ